MMSSIDLDETLRRLRAELSSSPIFSASDDSDVADERSAVALSSVLTTLRSLNEQARELLSVSAALPESCQQLFESNLQLEGEIADAEADARRESGAIRKELLSNKETLLRQLNELEERARQQTLACGGTLERLRETRSAAAAQHAALSQRLCAAQEQLQREEEENNAIEASINQLIAQNDEIRTLLGPGADELYLLEQELEETEARYADVQEQHQRRLAVVREQSARLNWHRHLFAEWASIDFERDQLTEAALDRLVKALTDRQQLLRQQVDEKRAAIATLQSSLSSLQSNSSILTSLLGCLHHHTFDQPSSSASSSNQTWQNVSTGGRAFVDRTLQLIDGNQITTLDLSGQHIGPAAAVRIADAVARNSSLTTLIMDGNPIGPAGGAALARMLTKNSTLLWLGVDNTGIGPLGVADVARALAGNDSLLVVGLGGNRIDWAVDAVAEALRVNSSLLMLGLDNCAVDAAAAQKLAPALAANSSLLVVGMENNPLGPDGVAAVAQLLRSNDRLVALSLDNTDAGPQGAAAVAQLLQRQAGLLMLGFGRNSVGNDGMAAFAAALATNSSLLMLSLDHNAISCVAAVERPIAQRGLPFALLLGGNPVDAAALAAVAAAVDHSKAVHRQVTVRAKNTDAATALLIGGPGSPLKTGFVRKFFPQQDFPNLHFQFVNDAAADQPTILV